MLYSTRLMTILSIRKCLKGVTFQKFRTFSSKVSKRNAFCKSTAYCLVTFKTFAQ